MDSNFNFGPARSGEQSGDAQVLVRSGPVYAFTVAQQLPRTASSGVCGCQSRKPRKRNDDAASVGEIDTQLIVGDLDAAGERTQFRA
jgi:hypothetical protein